jgi:cell division protein FtsB
MKEINNPKYKSSIILKIALVICCFYLLFVIVTQQFKINAKQSQLTDLNSEISTQQLTNDELSHTIDEQSANNDAYAEEYARSEFGYAKQGEKVYVNIDGN